MSEPISPDSEKHLGVDLVLINQTEHGKLSGTRILTQEDDSLTKVTSGNFEGFKYLQQEFKPWSTSSNWKEYILDKKSFSGALLNNGLLMAFENTPELTLAKLNELLIGKYPNAKMEALFTFNGETTGSRDILIRSMAEMDDVNADRLAGYFTRSIGLREDVGISIMYKDGNNAQFEGTLRQYAEGH